MTFCLVPCLVGMNFVTLLPVSLVLILMHLLGPDTSNLYFYFAKYSVNAGRLSCKDLLKSRFIVFEAFPYPRVNGQNADVESDSDSNPTGGVSIVNSSKVIIITTETCQVSTRFFFKGRYKT